MGQTLVGCGKLPFEPSISVAPDRHEASTPSGMTVEINVPQGTTLSAVGLSEADITGIVVTDTVPIDPIAKPDHMTVLTVAPLLAETIMNVFADDSVSAIFGGENQLF